MLQRVRAVLFDAVGTLMYPSPPVAQVYCDIGQRFGSKKDISQIDAAFRASLKRHNSSDLESNQDVERSRWQRIVREVFDDLPESPQLFEALWSHFAAARHWALYDDVPRTWKALQQSGRALGIASNFDDRLAGICREIHLLASCQQIFWSASLGFSKPHRGFFEAIQTRLDLPPEQILLVGDDAHNDVAGGRRAGWQTILLDRSGQPSDQQTVTDLGELLQRNRA